MDCSCLGKSAERIAPHGCLVIAQLITASYMLLTKVVLVQGISSSVFLVYQFILATIFMAALSFIFERRKRPPLTKQILCWIFLLALIGVTLTQSMLAAALYFTSSAIESSVLNMLPAITYILSLISKQDKLEIHTIWGKGKILGTLLSVSGALTLMLWHGSDADVMSTSLRNWLVGLVMVVVGVIAFGTWILMLEPVTKRYPAELSMTAIMFFFATLQTSVIAAILTSKASQWQLQWDLELLNIFIGGALNSGLANFFMAICARLKGPVFVSSFSPLGLLFTTILESAFLGHQMSAGSFVGSVMIVMGLYIYLWSKSKEEEHHSMDGKDSITTSLISDHSSGYAAAGQIGSV